MIIAIDTSTEMASVALVRDGEALAELSWRCGQSHTTQLLPSLVFLLEKTGSLIRDASGIIVARGPGSFNGLRVGVGTAKGLAFSLGVPLVGIGTMEVEAYPHAETGLPVCPIFNAGRGEIAAALYQKRDGRWEQVVAENITTIDKLCAGISTPTIFCGAYVKSVAGELQQKLGSKAIIPSSASRLRRAYFLAELGLKRLEAGDTDDVRTLQPLYLRRPPITKSKQRTMLERRS